MRKDGLGMDARDGGLNVGPSSHGCPDTRLRIALIRHAPTPGNLEGRYIGATDEALSEDGRTLAYAMRPRQAALRPSLLLTSGLRRCDETAAILFPALSPTHVPGLAEMRFGAFEDKTYAELSGDPRYQAWVDAECTTPCPGGEGQAGFVGRVREALATALDECVGRLAIAPAKLQPEGSPGTDAPTGESSFTRRNDPFAHVDVAMLVHAGTIMAAMSALAQPPRPYWDWKASYCAGYAADAVRTENGWQLAHVRELPGGME